MEKTHIHSNFRILSNIIQRLRTSLARAMRHTAAQTTGATTATVPEGEKTEKNNTRKKK